MWSSVLLFGWIAASTAAPKVVGIAELEKALKAYRNMAQLDVDFKQTKILKDMDLKLPSEGHLTLKLPDLVVWKLMTPQPMTVTLDKQKITIDDGSSHQTFSQEGSPSAKDRESFSLLLDWLKLDAKAIVNRYRVERDNDHHYLFTAKDAEHAFLKSLVMDLDDLGHLTRLNFSEASGDEIQLKFGPPKIHSQKK